MSDRDAKKAQVLGKLRDKYAAQGGAGTPGPEYDPHKNRQVPQGTTDFETLVHMVKGNFGTGILAMPEGFQKAGIFVGLVGIFIIGWLATYGLHILVKAQYIICQRLGIPVITYTDSIRAAAWYGPSCFNNLANVLAFFTDLFLCVYQIGICCVYVIFTCVNLKAIIDPLLASPKPIEIYIAWALIPFTLVMMIPNLKYLAPFSLFSNIITLISFSFILYFVFQDLPPISQRTYAGTFYVLPLFFGTALFALDAVGVIVTVENNMKNPGSFHWVLNVSMVFITICYVILGFFGYWKYGEKTETTVTLNLPDHILTKLAQGLYAFAIYISYALNGYVPVDILWNTYLSPHFPGHPVLGDYIFRTLMVLFTFLLAAFMPLLGLFISLFGCFCLSGLGIAFPAIMNICVYWPNELGAWKWILWKDILLMAFGVIALVAGTYTSLNEIVIELKKIY